MSIEKNRWITLGIQILIGTAVCYSYGLSVLIGPLSAERGWGIEEILMTYTISLWIGTPSVIIGGILRDKFGNKKCIVVGGFLTGLSIIISGYVTSVTMFVILEGVLASFFTFVVSTAQMSNIGILFPDKRGFALGLLNGGMALGGALLAPGMTFLIGSFNVSTALLIEGIVFIIIMCVLGMFVVNAPDDYRPEGWSPQNETEELLQSGIETTWKEMIKTPAFWLIVLMLILCGIGPNMAMSNGALMSQTAVGASETKAAWIVSLISVSSGIAGLIFGPVADKVGGCKALAVIALIEGVMMAVSATVAAGNMPIFIVTMAALGLGYGGMVTIYQVLTMNVFGSKHFGINYGVIGINALITSSVAPQLSARLDVLTSLLIAGVLALAGCAVCIAANKAVKKHMKNSLAELQTMK